MWPRPWLSSVGNELNKQDPGRLVLGIESSCDESAAAVVENGRRVLSSVVASQVKDHAPFGGVVPELASRRHLENLAPVVNAALAEAGVTLDDITGVAVTQGPGLIGALLIGLNLAKSLAWGRGLPLVGVSHLEGHLAALSLGEAPPPFPFLALLVSGGHTSLFLVREPGKQEELGCTVDDAAGEAFDKVAKLYGLGYPGGVIIDRMAASGDPSAIVLPRPRLHDGTPGLQLLGAQERGGALPRGQPGGRLPHRGSLRRVPGGGGGGAGQEDPGRRRAPRGEPPGPGRGGGGQPAPARRPQRGRRPSGPGGHPASPEPLHRQRGHDRGRRLPPFAGGPPHAAERRRHQPPAPGWGVAPGRLMHPAAILKAHGLMATKKRGQNYLTQPPTAEAIAAHAGIAPGDTVLEIGAGLGALTLPLAAKAKRVIALEVDRGVFAALQQVLATAGAANVEARLADALRLDWEALAAEVDGPLVVVGNLPYSISSPLLFDLLEHRALWKGATLMLQKELAVRLASGPGGKDWGRLSVLVRMWCEVRPGQEVGPGQFFPRPAVASAVVHLAPRPAPAGELGPGGEAFLSRAVKAAFSQRRKTLANSLAGGLQLPREAALALLETAAIEPTRRAETLSLNEFAALARALAEADPA